jgi:hypothetical protein
MMRNTILPAFKAYHLARAHRKTRTGLSRPSNRSLFAAPIPAGKRLGDAIDRARIFGDECLLRLDRDGPSRVSLAKATGS